ncbi:MAG: NHL repeat-containing protein [Chloroflexota bacterium]|nr:NHL repeat-containing protein [Chloroflexota bacterium]MEC9365839.1 NHL repeat-containing protein [Chloroflexota bacterium]MED5409758.1 NHL repeat-containing protein [Chloroflexota bacterium]MEE3344978.1 NHL repeat-containing protein [Chloroflexota bacterium]
MATTLPFELLRSGFPYYMTLGQRRVTSNPVDIGFGKENVYVLTRGGLGTEVRVINWEDENLGTLGGASLFQWPAALLVDGDENLYVTDEANHKVVVMDKDGELIDSWGEQGSGSGQLNRPSGMCFDLEGNIVLSDAMNSRIQRFTRDGKLLQVFGEAGEGEGQLNMPWGLTVDQFGDILVADWKNDRIQRFGSEGEFKSAIGSHGTDKGQFRRPSSVAVDGHGDIYISDWQNDRVQLFNKDERYIQSFHGNASLSRSGKQYVLSNLVTLRLRAEGDFEKTQRLNAPMTVKVDDQFRLFITDFGNHRIQIYQKDAVALSETEIAPKMRNPILFTT